MGVYIALIGCAALPRHKDPLRQGGCLTDSDEPDGYVVAGTVYAAAHEPSDCLGVEGGMIRITDARGQVIEWVSNRAGNFYLKSSKYRLALPFTAVISATGRTRKMEHVEQDAPGSATDAACRMAGVATC